MAEAPQVHGPYLTTQSAAEYCGYSYDHFRSLVRRFQIPRRGPGSNRYAVSDLDRWMEAPDCFRDQTHLVHPKKREIQLIPLKQGG